MWSKGIRNAPSYHASLHCRRYGYVHVPKKTTPHLLGHGSVWRSCYVVYPNTQAVDPFTKYQWLTKTVVIKGLPERMSKVVVPDESEVVANMKDHVTETLAYQVHDNPAKLHTVDLSTGLLQAAFSSVWQHGSRYNHLAHSNLTYNPNTECYWRRNGENYICHARPMYMLHTTNPLELFCDPGTAAQLPMPHTKYQPSFLGLFKHSFDQIDPFGGCKRQSPYSFAHTLFVEDKKSRTDDQTLAHGLMQLFAQAAGETVQNGYKLDSDLYFPLASQCVVTNGKRFTFLSYQLNTLDLSEQGGTRSNFLWVGPSLELYDGIQRGKGLVGFNENCARLLAQFLLHKPLRAKPALSGFVLARQAEEAKAEKRLGIKQYLGGLKRQKALQRKRKAKKQSNTNEEHHGQVHAGVGGTRDNV